MPAKPPPTIYLIAGCNGAGKTTFAKEYLPKEVKCLRFLNADEIARGLSPFDPSAAAVKSGRLLLTEIRDSLNKRETFGLESTLSGKTYLALFRKALTQDYEIELHYLLLASARQAIDRVRRRVQSGGHHVPVADIRRRFHRSRAHLFDYLPLSTRWAVWDAQTLPVKPLASHLTSDIPSLKKLVRP